MVGTSIFVVAFLALLGGTSAFKNRQILQTHFQHLHINTSTLNDVRHGLRETTLERIRGLSKIEQSQLIHAAKLTYHTQKYAQLSAWDWLEYDRTGSAANYMAKLEARNLRLTQLVIGHLVDEVHNLGSKLYLDEIFNGVWTILEETNWAYPWTMVHLPEANEVWVDLGQAAMAKQLAWVKLLMGDKFDTIKDAKINQRIDYELYKRVFSPYIKFNFKWDGEGGNKVVNNWNSQINSNILRAAVYTMSNEAEFNKLFQKTVRSVDAFLNSQGDDGGCEEGPSYWIEAGGRLIEYIMTLIHLEPASLEYFAKQPLIKAIGDYSWKMRIDHREYVSFSDSLPKIHYPPSMVYLYGELFQDPLMKRYASYLHHENDKKHDVRDLDGFVNFILVKKILDQLNPMDVKPKTVALRDLQIAAAHPHPGRNDSKLFLAGKMGTNYEFHGHNDVGNYVIYQSGNPVLIDVGAGDKTTNGPKFQSESSFSESQFHNVPTINGQNQRSGSPFQSSDVSIVVGGDESFVTLRGDLKTAYPYNAEIDHWNRIIYMDRNIDEVKIQDFYKLKQYLGAHKFNYMTTGDMNITKTATGIRLTNDKGVYVNMLFHWNLFDLQTERISLKGDKALSDVWGPSVQRFSLVTKPEVNQLVNYITFVFRSDDYVPVIP